MRRARLFVGLGILLVYVLGLLSGGVVSRALMRRQARRLQAAGPEVFYAHTRAAVLDDMLNLDRAQRREIESILQRRYLESRALRQRVETGPRVLWEAGMADIRTTLHPQQLADFDEFVRRGRLQQKAPDKPAPAL